MCGWSGGRSVGWFGEEGRRGEGGQVKAEVITGRRTPPVFPSALALYHEAAEERPQVNSSQICE